MLESALGHSFAALQEWIAFGEPATKIHRARLWRDEIAPRLERLESAATSGDDERAVYDLRTELQTIKILQWQIEDAARSIGNVEARFLYEDEVVTLRTRAVRYLAQPPAKGSRADQADAHLLRSRLRGMVLQTDAALFRLLENYTSGHAQKLKQLTELTRGLARQLSAIKLEDGLHSVFAAEVLAFVERSEDVLEVRGQKNWNKTNSLFRTELQPAEERAAALLASIVERQERRLIKETRGLFRWSFVILALALLVGVLSGASIYYAYQLEDRADRALASAKSLGQYALGDRIGSGGMGQVFRAQHALLRRPAAIKVMGGTHALDPESQARFLKEVQLTSTLSHPNTIAIYDYGRSAKGLLYYAMELLDGVSLDALVRSTGPVPPARVAYILGQICGSLSEAHGLGLLHRDIKPSNIMLVVKGGVPDVVKVLDFGLVSEIAKLSQSTTAGLVGTPAYLAPELVVAESNASVRSDIYAIGAIGYFLLTGTEMFEFDNVEEVLRAQVEDECERPSIRLGAALPVDLEAIVMGCLAKEPGQRPASTNDLERLFESADLDAWSRTEAHAWWTQYGESVRALSRDTADSSSSGVGGNFDIGSRNLV
ncbi:MAG: serine/threonine protein kinase [Kofleriaceae bacterium]|nr:serine/threonine protein kinase [Kofleriaceae bacterium]